MLKASKEIIQKIPRQRNILPNQVPKGILRHKAIGCPTPTMASARPCKLADIMLRAYPASTPQVIPADIPAMKRATSTTI